MQVRLRFRPGKLDLPDGRDRSADAPEQTTRLDIDVQTRASGSLPFPVDITSPDGEVDLASTRYSVRSTAAPGVGLPPFDGAGALPHRVVGPPPARVQRARKLVDGPTGPT